MVRALLAIPIFETVVDSKLIRMIMRISFFFLSLVDVLSWLDSSCEIIAIFCLSASLLSFDLKIIPASNWVISMNGVKPDHSRKPRNDTIRFKTEKISSKKKKNSEKFEPLSVVDTFQHFKIRGVPRFGVTRKNSGGLGRDRDISLLVRSRPNFPDSLPFSRTLPTLPEIFRPAAKFKRSILHNPLSSHHPG